MTPGGWPAARREHPDQPVTVWLGAGDYTLLTTFDLTDADSGTKAAPVTYRAAAGDVVRLINARRLAASDFHPVSSPEALARIAEPLRSKIVELGLKGLVTHAQRPADVFTDSGGMVDLYVDGRRMRLSRYPNEGFMTMKRVLDTGGGLQSSNWRDAGAQAYTRPGKSGGLFEYRDEDAGRFEAWKQSLDRGVWLKGYWRIPWENPATRIASIDSGKHTVALASPVPGGIGNKYHRPEGNGKEPYWAFNLLEEIDQPGEWCVDFKDQALYFYPPRPLSAAQVLLADNDGPAIRLNGASHVTLRGLTVEAGLGHGIVISGGEQNVVAGCTVRNVDRYAVVLDGGKRSRVQSCDLYDLGAGGVWLGGGDETSSPRIAAGHQVINNHIHHFAQIERVYATGVNAGFTGGGNGGHHVAVGMLVAHNLIHDTPHGGVLYGSWDSTFEYNEIFRYCTVLEDLVLSTAMTACRTWGTIHSATT